MNFDTYWAETYKTTGQPAIFDMAMREIALSAWNSAITEAIVECYAYGDRNFDDCRGAYECADVIKDMLANIK